MIIFQVEIVMVAAHFILGQSQATKDISTESSKIENSELKNIGYSNLDSDFKQTSCYQGVIKALDNTLFEKSSKLDDYLSHGICVCSDKSECVKDNCIGQLSNELLSTKRLINLMKTLSEQCKSSPVRPFPAIEFPKNCSIESGKLICDKQNVPGDVNAVKRDLKNINKILVQLSYKLTNRQKVPASDNCTQKLGRMRTMFPVKKRGRSPILNVLMNLFFEDLKFHPTESSQVKQGTIAALKVIDALGLFKVKSVRALRKVVHGLIKVLELIESGSSNFCDWADIIETLNSVDIKVDPSTILHSMEQWRKATRESKDVARIRYFHIELMITIKERIDYLRNNMLPELLDIENSDADIENGGADTKLLALINLILEKRPFAETFSDEIMSRVFYLKDILIKLSNLPGDLNINLKLSHLILNVLVKPQITSTLYYKGFFNRILLTYRNALLLLRRNGGYDSESFENRVLVARKLYSDHLKKNLLFDNILQLGDPVGTVDPEEIQRQKWLDIQLLSGVIHGSVNKTTSNDEKNAKISHEDKVELFHLYDGCCDGKNGYESRVEFLMKISAIISQPEFGSIETAIDEVLRLLAGLAGMQSNDESESLQHDSLYILTVAEHTPESLESAIEALKYRIFCLRTILDTLTNGSKTCQYVEVEKKRPLSEIVGNYWIDRNPHDLETRFNYALSLIDAILENPDAKPRSSIGAIKIRINDVKFLVYAIKQNLSGTHDLHYELPLTIAKHIVYFNLDLVETEDLFKLNYTHALLLDILKYSNHNPSKPVSTVRNAVDSFIAVDRIKRQPKFREAVLTNRLVFAERVILTVSHMDTINKHKLIDEIKISSFGKESKSSAEEARKIIVAIVNGLDSVQSDTTIESVIQALDYSRTVLSAIYNSHFKVASMYDDLQSKIEMNPDPPILNKQCELTYILSYLTKGVSYEFDPQELNDVFIAKNASLTGNARSGVPTYSAGYAMYESPTYRAGNAMLKAEKAIETAFEPILKDKIFLTLDNPLVESFHSEAYIGLYSIYNYITHKNKAPDRLMDDLNVMEQPDSLSTDFVDTIDQIDDKLSHTMQNLNTLSEADVRFQVEEQKYMIAKLKTRIASNDFGGFEENDFLRDFETIEKLISAMFQIPNLTHSVVTSLEEKMAKINKEREERNNTFVFVKDDVSGIKKHFNVSHEQTVEDLQKTLETLLNSISKCTANRYTVIQTYVEHMIQGTSKLHQEFGANVKFNEKLETVLSQAQRVKNHLTTLSDNSKISKIINYWNTKLTELQDIYIDVTKMINEWNDIPEMKIRLKDISSILNKLKQSELERQNVTKESVAAAKLSLSPVIKEVDEVDKKLVSHEKQLESNKNMANLIYKHLMSVAESDKNSLLSLRNYLKKLEETILINALDNQLIQGSSFSTDKVHFCVGDMTTIGDGEDIQRKLNLKSKSNVITTGRRLKYPPEITNTPMSTTATVASNPTTISSTNQSKVSSTNPSTVSATTPSKVSSTNQSMTTSMVLSKTPSTVSSTNEVTTTVPETTATSSSSEKHQNTSATAQSETPQIVYAAASSDTPQNISAAAASETNKTVNLKSEAKILSGSALKNPPAIPNTPKPTTSEIASNPPTVSSMTRSTATPTIPSTVPSTNASTTAAEESFAKASSSETLQDISTLDTSEKPQKVSAPATSETLKNVSVPKTSETPQNVSVAASPETHQNASALTASEIHQKDDYVRVPVRMHPKKTIIPLNLNLFHPTNLLK